MKERDEKATTYDSKIEQDAYIDGWDAALESEVVNKLVDALTKYSRMGSLSFDPNIAEKCLKEFEQAKEDK